MSFGAALISGGSSIVGGLIGAKASRDNTQDQIDYASSRDAQSTELQREFARNGIKWRAQDAREAGLHPLFALGGAGATYTPSAQSINFDNGGGHMGRAISEAGQNVSRAMLASQTEDQRALHAAQLRALEAQSQRDLAHSQYYLSEIARRATNPAGPPESEVVTGAYSSPVTVNATSFDGRRTRLESSPLYADAVKLEADPMSSRQLENPERTAGKEHPSLREFHFGGGFKVLLPATGGGGVPEEIDASMLPLIIGANVRAYGARWMVDAMAYFTGRAPADERGGEHMEKLVEMAKYFGRRTHDLVKPYSGRRENPPRFLPPSR